MNKQTETIRSPEAQRRQQDKERLYWENFENMIQWQMKERQGRDFVRWIIFDVLQHERENNSTNSSVYRMSERQNAALEVKKSIEKIYPGLWDQLIIEKRQDSS